MTSFVLARPGRRSSSCWALNCLCALIDATREVNAHRKASAEPSAIAQPPGVDLVGNLLPVTNYLPDIEALRRRGVRLVVAGIGEWGSQETCLVCRGQRILADRVGCKLNIFLAIMAASSTNLKPLPVRCVWPSNLSQCRPDARIQTTGKRALVSAERPLRFSSGEVSRRSGGSRRRAR